MKNNNSPSTDVQMMIRKPVEEVFESMINPELTKNFWFTKGSGRLEANRKVKWEWEMYNLSTDVIVKEIVPNQKILIEWSEPVRTVSFTFRKLSDNATYVTIKEWGYGGSGDELLKNIKDSTGGFTTVLDGMKAFLEHGINLNLIEDKYPKEVVQHGN